MNIFAKGALKTLVVTAALIATAGITQAQDKIRVLKVVPQGFQLTVVDVGVEHGVFAKHNLELAITGSGGGAKLHQAMASGAVDIGLGTGPGFGFVAKGVPEIAIAATHGAPRSLGITVSKASSLYPSEMTVDDLKGKKIGVATTSSQTYFLTRSISIAKGWGPEGIETVALGGVPAQMAAMKVGNVDGIMNSADIGTRLAANGTGRLLVNAGDYVPDYHTMVIYATNKFREENPDAVRRFLAAYFETVAMIKEDPSIMVATASRVLEVPEEILSAALKDQIDMIKDDGYFDEKALDAIAEGLVVMGILPEKPDMSKLYTEEYLTKN